MVSLIMAGNTEEEEGLEKKNEFYFEQIILTEYV